LDIKGLGDFASQKPLELIIKHTDGTSESVLLYHTYNDSQIKWFKAGSALNTL